MCTAVLIGRGPSLDNQHILVTPWVAPSVSLNKEPVRTRTWIIICTSTNTYIQILEILPGGEGQGGTDIWRKCTKIWKLENPQDIPRKLVKNTSGRLKLSKFMYSGQNPGSIPPSSVYTSSYTRCLKLCSDHWARIFKLLRSPGIDSASLCIPPGGYYNPIPTWFLAHRDFS
jgi:hypothetical protein